MNALQIKKIGEMTSDDSKRRYLMGGSRYVPDNFGSVKEAVFWLLDLAGYRRIENPVKQPLVHQVRSEERRVGKECRSRWSPYH